MFKEIKRIVARDTLLAYLGSNEELKIHSNASVFQLGSVMSQNGKLITFYSRKITSGQIRYTVAEK